MSNKFTELKTGTFDLKDANDKDIAALFGKDIKDMSFSSLQHNMSDSVNMELENMNRTIQASIGGNTIKRFEDFMDEFETNRPQFPEQTAGLESESEDTEDMGETQFQDQMRKKIKKGNKDESEESEEDMMRATQQKLY